MECRYNEIIDSIISHTDDNDIKFQSKKIKKRISRRKFILLDNVQKKEEFFKILTEVKYSVDFEKKKSKILATEMILKIVRSKLGA